MQVFVLLGAYLLSLSLLGGLVDAKSPLSPRMIFTEKDTAVKRLSFPHHQKPVQILLDGQPDTVIAVGRTGLTSYNFQSHTETPAEKVWGSECLTNHQQPKDCYNITLVHKREEPNMVLVCGTNGKEATCCNMNLSVQNSTCVSSEKMSTVQNINAFNIKEGEPSALVESADSTDLYITYSGSNQYVGIYKFGKNRVGPVIQHKEQHYVGSMLTTRDKVYAFYKEKNRNTAPNSEMWLPFVTRVCKADVGGPKNIRQFRWTSQLNARLFCGDPNSRQHFSELVDVATVSADQPQDTRVYALFRNEWDMSAVCVYTLQDIDNIFATSPFKDYSTENLKDRRTCVDDSRKISPDVLKIIDETSEMEKWVQPVNTSGLLLFNHHNYTHIHVDSLHYKENKDHTVLYLSLNNGWIHKVAHNENQTLVIAEHRPFHHQVHILSIDLHPSSRKLYVNSGTELVQLEVANCAQYGNSCEDCVLARDPYCGWNGTHCAPQTHDPLLDVTGGVEAACRQPGKALRYSTSTQAADDVNSIILPAQSKYFLQCPVSSHHAKYTWRHGESSTSCSWKEPHCLFLIDSMGDEQKGIYQCVSEEMGHRKVRAEYDLQVQDGAGCQLSNPLVWVSVTALLIMSLPC